MDANSAAAVALIGALSGVLGSLARSWLARPKTKAETENLNAATSVSMSAEAREWAQVFVQETKEAKVRAAKAEDRAEAAEHRADEIESGLIECYGYVRQLRDQCRALGGTPAALPVRLEALWRGRSTD